MTLKRKITKDEFAALAEGAKGFYKEDGDSYKLDAEEEDNSALKRAKDRETQLRKDLETKFNEMQTKLEEIEGVDAKKRGDIATLEKSWSTKLETQKSEYQAKLDKLNAHTTKTLVDNVALSIATKISSSPTLLLPHLRSRLVADFEGDEPKTRVLDAEGKPSAMTVDDLSKEFVQNKDFAPIITASKGSGGTAPKSTPNGAGAKSTEDLSKMKPTDLANHIRNMKAQS